MSRTVLANARIVLPDRVVEGRLILEDGRIAAVEPGGRAPADAVDCGGDLVMPGLVELHTDNLERHLAPRPRVHWPHAAAIVAHDAELAGAGITTVFDALRVGSIPGRSEGSYDAYARALASEILALRGRPGRCASATGCICAPSSVRRRSRPSWTASLRRMTWASCR